MSEDSIQNTPVKGSKNNFKGKIHVIVIILIILAVSFISALLIEKHTNKSIYSKLSVANYNQNNLNVSFNYPSVMSYNNALVEKLSKDNTPLVYNYAINSHQNLNLALSYQPIGSTLKLLNLSTSQLLNQIKNNTGDYITLINAKNSSAYSELYGSCSNYITNINNQQNLICQNELKGITTARVVGLDNNYQYILYLVMPDNVWSSNQKTWIQVEKSFTY